MPKKDEPKVYRARWLGTEPYETVNGTIDDEYQFIVEVRGDRYRVFTNDGDFLLPKSLGSYVEIVERITYEYGTTKPGFYYVKRVKNSEVVNSFWTVAFFYGDAWTVTIDEGWNGPQVYRPENNTPTNLKATFYEFLSDWSIIKPVESVKDVMSLVDDLSEVDRNDL